MADDEVADALKENAQGPRRVTGDEGSVEQHDPKDQIMVDRHLASKKAAKGGLGLRRVKVAPPGAT